MGSAIWYKKRNGGTKEREKLREKETTEKEHFADGIKKEKGKSSKEEKEKKKWENEIDSADNSRLHHWFLFLLLSFIHILKEEMLHINIYLSKKKKEIYLRLILNSKYG